MRSYHNHPTVRVNANHVHDLGACIIARALRTNGQADGTTCIRFTMESGRAMPWTVWFQPMHNTESVQVTGKNARALIEALRSPDVENQVAAAARVARRDI